jgi:cold shock CspA family protein
MAFSGDRRTGRVASYDPTKGLGWIVDIEDDAEGAKPTSVHFSEIRPAWPDDKLASRSTLLQGEYVEYSVGPNPKNPSRMCCKDVTGLGQGPLMMDHAVLRRVLRRSRDFDARVHHEPDLKGSRRGRVTSYHARKGWGFIQDLDSDDTFFVHFTEIDYYWRERLGADDDEDGDGDNGGSGHRNYYKPCLFTGEYVQFTVGSNPVTGQPCAKRVTGPRRGPLLMDFGTYRYIRYRNPGPPRPASSSQGAGTSDGAGDNNGDNNGYSTGYTSGYDTGYSADSVGQTAEYGGGQMSPQDWAASE